MLKDTSSPSKASHSEAESSPRKPQSISPIDIQDAVEKALDKKLKPILSRLAEDRQRASETKFNDIIGGIGYILGLVGVGAYFNYRKKKTKI